MDWQETFWLSLGCDTNILHLRFGLFSVYVVMLTILLFDVSENNSRFIQSPVHMVVELLPNIMFLI